MIKNLAVTIWCGLDLNIDNIFECKMMLAILFYLKRKYGMRYFAIGFRKTAHNTVMLILLEKDNF